MPRSLIHLKSFIESLIFFEIFCEFYLFLPPSSVLTWFCDFRAESGILIDLRALSKFCVDLLEEISYIYCWFYNCIPYGPTCPAWLFYAIEVFWVGGLRYELWCDCCLAASAPSLCRLTDWWRISSGYAVPQQRLLNQPQPPECSHYY